MMQVATDKQYYLEEFERFSKDLSEPDWLRGLRQSAIARFEKLGFPTARNEDWRFTNVSLLAQSAFELAHGATEVSSSEGLPMGVIVDRLPNLLRTHSDILERHLAQHAQFKDHAVTALNTAFMSDVVFVFIPKGINLDRPVEILHSPGGRKTVSCPRTLVIAEENAQVTLVERYVGSDGEYFTNAVTEVVLGQAAVVDHYKVQSESRGAFHLANTQAVLSTKSNFTTHYVSLGGQMVRNEVRVLFQGENAEATVNGLYLAGGRQHVDNFTVIDHAKPHCASHELYKGILADQAHGVFNGKIFVRPDAQKTDAKQTNKVLLLSEDAVINTKPQLEIFADDVKCTHGATIGQLDAEALFYMRARGIALEDARKLLIYAFANDLIGRVKVDSLREELEERLMKLQLTAEQRSDAS